MHFRPLQRLSVHNTKLLLTRARPCSYQPGIYYGHRNKNTAIDARLVDERKRRKMDTSLPLFDLDNLGKNAYRHRKTWELIRSHFIFHLCSYPLLVKHSLWLMNVGRMLLGHRLFTAVMRRTIYGQFVGGETVDDLSRSILALRALGIGTMLFVPLEEDEVGQSDNSEKYERNMETMLDCVARSRDMGGVYPHSQMKITAIVPAALCTRIAEIYPNPTETPSVCDAMADIFLENANTLAGLSHYDNKILVDAVKRLDTIGQAALDNDVFLLLDAEYIRMNPAFRIFSIAMMLKFNITRPAISYTYQNYLKETLDVLTADERFVRSRDVCFGVKLVRGAYINQERHLAEVHGYPDPVHSTFDATSDMYRRSMEYMLDHVAAEPEKYYVIIATHNETSVREALAKMKRENIKPDNGSVFFGSSYGMCDHLATTLGEAGYRVYKSMPYGTVEDTMPYLYRRAVENGSILGSTQKERVRMRRVILSRVTFGLL